MPNQMFKGTSDSGDFSQALLNAIKTAKEQLGTDYVVWELATISGENGGFLLVNILHVEIEVKSGT